MTRLAAVAFACVLALVGTADARPRHKMPRADSAVGSQCLSDNDGRTTCQGAARPSGGLSRVAARYEGGTVIGGRPAGCPRRYCACALSLKIFGRIIPDLNLAANWPRRFQRVTPAPTMVAARGGHAFQLLDHVSGLVWRVYDANSGHGLIRIHERSIAGYVIVDPHASRLAMR